PTVFADRAKELLQRDGAVSIFGCWTSVSRKAVLPVVESLGGLLWYPAPSEGLEASPSIVYTGTTASQQIVPAIDYLLRQGKQRFFLLGSDSVAPRVSNIVIQAQIAASADASVVGEEYASPDATDFAEIVGRVEGSQADILVNTLFGRSNA